MDNFYVACLTVAIPFALAAGGLWGYAYGLHRGARRAPRPTDEDERVRRWPQPGRPVNIYLWQPDDPAPWRGLR